MKLLEWEGFRFERTVDIFDGGPMVAAERANIRTLKESQIVRVTAGEPEGRDTGLIATTGLENYRCILLKGDVSGDGSVTLSRQDIDTLQIKEADTARVWIRQN